MGSVIAMPIIETEDVVMLSKSTGCYVRRCARVAVLFKSVISVGIGWDAEKHSFKVNRSRVQNVCCDLWTMQHWQRCHSSAQSLAPRVPAFAS